MSEATEQWLEMTSEWLEAELAKDRAKDEAAFSRFMVKVMQGDRE